MNDIKPVRPRQQAQSESPRELPQVPSSISSEELPVPKLNDEEPYSGAQKPANKRKVILVILGAVIGLIVVLFLSAYLWYQNALQPRDTSKTDKVKVEVVSGSSPSQIGQLLEEQGIIASGFAFDIYTRLTDTKGSLQAGSYRLAPSESVEQIVNHMISGRTDQFSLTFYPGATLVDTTDTPENKKTDVKTVLVRAGYSEAEIATALSKTYDHPLLAAKPADADLEGYVYGETYSFVTDTTVEQILTRTFDEYYRVVQENDLEAAFKKQGLTLHEGIIMASIVQREVPGAADQKQVAQVFLKRYRDGMALGSDITAYYGADKIGERRTVAVDTPYNTRIHEGLPPGPIATPGESALLAVANPAKGDYVYFLSGDDEVTYFARTVEEHEKNIRDHCQVKCAME